MPQVYWFKDGKQISKRSEHYRISREADGTCTLHTAAASLDDDGNYTIMASNPEVITWTFSSARARLICAHSDRRNRMERRRESSETGSH